MTKATSLLAALTFALGSSTALAQSDSPAGIPADPNTQENVQPGPGAANPSDPAAGSDPAARVPTSPPGSEPSAVEGMGTGEAGLESPAGIPADPNTHENVQPGPGVANPSDPAAGSDPAARIPTDDATD
ncbi:hypothetical protein W911_16190 [Hyphomicrobium nitrativorans NL23]|uniref:Mucin n=1 Tax=Hyphomicrobium nitrativorans NL23 TaxID=1029756 RepID=V5SGD6_9HYPH|nr:hypothetical protein [Hyphomicrobium nitrativorans]AHB49598.1 hypothetical protein W911_16190 [Hyphomicrobium nitrativorans NL23]